MYPLKTFIGDYWRHDECGNYGIPSGDTTQKPGIGRQDPAIGNRAATDAAT